MPAYGAPGQRVNDNATVSTCSSAGPRRRDGVIYWIRTEPGAPEQSTGADYHVVPLDPALEPENLEYPAFKKSVLEIVQPLADRISALERELR